MAIEAAPSAAPAGAPSTAGPSLRDTLTSAADAVETAAPAAAPSAPPESPAAATPGASSSPAPTTSQGAVGAPQDGRVRNPDGTFAKKDGAAEQPAAPAAPAADAPKRPSSWKAELDSHWATLPRAVQDEIHRRESDALRGITQYRQALESMKPVIETIQQHRDLLASANMQPHEFIGRMASWHKTLSGSDPQAKLRAFADLSQQYGVPLNELLVQGEDGKVYLNQSYFQQQRQQAQQQAPQSLTRDDVQQMLAQTFAQQKLGTLVTDFTSAKDQSGNPLYPHHREVWQSMDALLRSRLATDLPTAYKAALALPQHAHLAPAQQPALSDQARSATEAAQAAARAKANAVSPRSQNQTELVTDPLRGNPLRNQLEGAYEAFLGNGGRV